MHEPVNVLMVVVDANGAFYVLLEGMEDPLMRYSLPMFTHLLYLTESRCAAVNNIKCWLVGEEVILWSKDAVTSLASQPVSRTVQVCSVEEALAREQERGNCMHTLITNCSSHADAARSIGAHSVLVGASDSAADVGARIVSEVVRVRKVRLPDSACRQPELELQARGTRARLTTCRQNSRAC